MATTFALLRLRSYPYLPLGHALGPDGNRRGPKLQPPSSFFSIASSIAARSPAGLVRRCGMASRVMDASISVGLPDASAAPNAASNSLRLLTRKPCAPH